MKKIYKLLNTPHPLIGFALLGWGWASLAQAGGVPTLAPVDVVARQDPEEIAPADAASVGRVTREQLAARALLRPAEALETVPGLVVTQHTGDGKANQYFLRGFNLDHGTDFATSVLGVPMNLPTHAHGQGYLDLNGLIPELIEDIRYRKGPYAAEDGDFANAGSARIDYVRRLPEGLASLTLGEHQYRRGLVANSQATATPWGQGDLLYALEWSGNNGPWQVPEHLGKWNGLLRLSQGSRENGWSLAASHYQAQWTATDHIPDSAVASGAVDTYGSLDPTSGGNTRRSTLAWEYASPRGNGRLRANAYVVDYQLDLFSNFTYFLNNPTQGDQFEQYDHRRYGGGSVDRTWFLQWGERDVDVTLGSQLRQDRIGQVGLALTSGRQRLDTIREDRVTETSAALYGEVGVQWADKLRTLVGLRGDAARVTVNSDTPANSGNASAHLWSPKFTLILGPWAHTEFYLNSGRGFHSNDARGATLQVNPDPRAEDYLGPAARLPLLVRARGEEVGLRSQLARGYTMSLALWRLHQDSELVFAGDSGTTEALGASRRSGIEWTHYWTPLPGLTVDADLAFTRARFEDPALAGGDRIPNAVERVISLGIAYDPGSAWFGGLRLRHLGPAPLVEDNTQRSPAFTLVNLRAGYRLTRQTALTLDVLNLTNREASDIQYWYEYAYPAGNTVTGRLFHPTEPRTLRLTLTHRF